MRYVQVVRFIGLASFSAILWGVYCIQYISLLLLYPDITLTTFRWYALFFEVCNFQQHIHWLWPQFLFVFSSNFIVVIAESHRQIRTPIIDFAFPRYHFVLYSTYFLTFSRDLFCLYTLNVPVEFVPRRKE